MEKTLIILKPDCVNRGLLGEVLSRIERKGLKVAGMKMMKPSKAVWDEHYAHLKYKPFFPRLVEFMSSSPVVFAVIEGKDAVRVLRDLCGKTNARDAAPGTIRGDLAMSTQSNIIHASDSLETAQKEVARFFNKEELFEYSRVTEDLLYAKDERS
jgi:nucleoside-diphosphate kinase